MLKLPLEAALEQGLADIGVTLRDRVYGEEIRQQAAADDRTGKTTYQQEEERVQQHRLGPERLHAALYSEATEAQELAGRKILPFFMRRSEEYGDITVTYLVFPSEGREAYRTVADELVRGEKFEQYVKISDHTGLLASLRCGPETIEAVCIDEAIKDWRTRNKRSTPEVLARLHWLDNQPYDPQLVVNAVMTFFEGST